MGGGGIKSSQQNLANISTEQQQQAQQLSSQGQGLIQQGQSLQNPLIKFLTGIIGGNSTDTQQALSPVIGNITRNTNATRENIFDTTAPGAGRDVLLGENLRSQGEQVASAENNVFLSAFPELAQLGTANTSTGLGLTGAGITSLGNSASTSGTVLNSQVQQKAATDQLFGSLASTAGTIATGGIGDFGGGKSNSGGGGIQAPIQNAAPIPNFGQYGFGDPNFKYL